LTFGHEHYSVLSGNQPEFVDLSYCSSSSTYLIAQTALIACSELPYETNRKLPIQKKAKWPPSDCKRRESALLMIYIA
jgi:hypothetical protein